MSKGKTPVTLNVLLEEIEELVQEGYGDKYVYIWNDDDETKPSEPFDHYFLTTDDLEDWELDYRGVERDDTIFIRSPK